MLDTFKDMIKSFFQSRILPVAVVFILLFAILVNRLFSLQIADTDTYASQAAKRTEKTKSIIERYEKQVNQWFLEVFQTDLYVGAGYAVCSTKDL